MVLDFDKNFVLLGQMIWKKQPEPSDLVTLLRTMEPALVVIVWASTGLIFEKREFTHVPEPVYDIVLVKYLLYVCLPLAGKNCKQNRFLTASAHYNSHYKIIALMCPNFPEVPGRHLRPAPEMQ